MQAWCKSIKLLIISALLPGHYPSFIPAIDCGDPGTPTNGQRSLSSTTYNSVVTYTCDVGYTLQGVDGRICQSDGQWNGSVAQCIRKFVWLQQIVFQVCSLSLPPNSATCSNPCQNGGNCTAPDTCTCDMGWTGVQCEEGGWMGIMRQRRRHMNIVKLQHR